MSTTYLTTGELSRTLGWSPRFIDGLVRTNKIPTRLVDGEARFSREALVDWLEDKLHTLDHEGVVALDNQISPPAAEDAETDPITLQITRQGILWGASADGPDGVLDSLAEFAQATGAVTDAAVLRQSLAERERLCSTALPGGVALCHPRQPLPDIVWKPFVRVICLAEPVPFGAEDALPTRLFFLLGSATDSGHLKSLSRLARILDETTKSALLRAPSADAAHQIISSREVQIHRRRQALLARHESGNLSGDGI